MNGRYQTSDTALATFLIISGHKLLLVDYSQPRFEFSFYDSGQIRELSDLYISGKSLAEPIAYNRVNKKLLRLIRDRKQWEED